MSSLRGEPRRLLRMQRRHIPRLRSGGVQRQPNRTSVQRQQSDDNEEFGHAQDVMDKAINRQTKTCSIVAWR